MYVRYVSKLKCSKIFGVKVQYPGNNQLVELLIVCFMKVRGGIALECNLLNIVVFLSGKNSTCNFRICATV